MTLLNYCHFGFRIRLESECHVGDGSTAPLEELCKTEAREAKYKAHKAQRDDRQVEEPTALVTRAASEDPLIEITALRGALRAAVAQHDPKLAIRLLGREDLEDAETVKPDAAGLLWFYDGSLVPESEALDCSSLPFWDPKTFSFILVGHGRDPHLNAVRHGMLYCTEYLPRGLQFCFDAIYRGDPEEFARDVPEFFRLLSTEGTISLGAETGYGHGQIQVLTGEKSTAKHVYFDVSEGIFRDKEFDPQISDKCDSAQHEKGQRATFDLILKCPGPFLSVDATAQIKRTNSARDETFDLYPLYREPARPYLSGKSVLASLRGAAGRLEAIEAIQAEGPHRFSYDPAHVRVDDRYHLVTGYDDLKVQTERIFGVPGWGKLVRVENIEQVSSNHASYEADGLQLDTFTQAPIDGSLVAFHAPVDLEYRVVLSLDQSRYPAGKEKDREADAAFLRRVLAQVSKDDGIMLGHSVGTGFGWFDVREATS